MQKQNKKKDNQLQKVILGLGSNNSFMGMEPVELLAYGCKRLYSVMTDFTCSSLYESKAMYVTDQSDFYNMVVMGNIDDSISPYQFLNKIHQIEAEFGRDRSKEIRFGPRSLDIDIEIFGNLQSSDPDLLLPHPRTKERQFVLLPALEILKKDADVQIRKDFESALKLLPDQGVRLCSEQIQKRFSEFFSKGGRYGSENGSTGRNIDS